MKKNKKYTIVILLTTIILSLGVCLSQIPYRSFFEQDFEEQLENNIPLSLDNLIVPLYTQAVLSQTSESEGPFDVLFDQTKLINPDNHDQIAYEVNESIEENLNNRLPSDQKTLDYAIIINQDKEHIYTNVKEGFSDIEDYRWYVEFHFDENGVPSIQKASENIKEYTYLKRLKTIQHDYFSQYLAYIFEANNEIPQSAYDEYGNLLTDFVPESYLGIKNVDMTLAVTKNSAINDAVLWYDNQPVPPYSNALYCTGVTLIGVLMLCGIVALCLPKRYFQEAAGIHVFLKLPLELYLIIPIIMLMTGFLLFPLISNYYQYGLPKVEPQFVELLTLLVNALLFLYTAFMILYVMLLVQHLKQISDNGFGNYCKKRILLVRIPASIYRHMIEIDFQEKAIRYLIIIFIGNGLFFLLTYLYTKSSYSNRTFIFMDILFNGILCYIATKTYRRLKQNYDDMRNILTDIANGNFNKRYNTDLGIFQNMNDSLEEIRTGFSSAVEKEVKSQRMKTELITNVSHDLKTPLTSIVSYVDLLKHQNVTEEEKKQYLDTLEINASRLKHLIEDLFEISKASSGTVSLNPSKLDLCELLNQILFEFQDALHARSLEIRYSSNIDKAYAYLDPQKTYRIFSNLLGNICKYAMPSSRVYLMIEVTDDICISFKNISENEITLRPDEIIERFTRGDTSRNSEGSGLGLSIAQSFTQIQGGQFKVEIDGDLFKVTLSFPIDTETKDLSN